KDVRLTDAAYGDAAWRIPLGAPFSAPPDQWRCPVQCGQSALPGAPGGVMTDNPTVAEDKLLFFEILGQRDADAVRRLVTTFRMIHATRMRDLPFLNPALTVEGVGFRHWQDRLL